MGVKARLNEAKKLLKRFNKEVYGDLSGQLKDMEVQLHSAQISALDDPGEQAFKEVATLEAKLIELKKVEESMYKHKSRID
ncbi:unnamed protein product [Linum trigynum]|uniref:PspA/IM30 family protein n=1 Tax=Linum trigynum TaxID=586398 RepID=A0AAV2E910_9ROSI